MSDCMIEIILISIGIISICYAIVKDSKKLIKMQYKKSKDIGDIGESIVANKLKQLSDKFEVFNDIRNIKGVQIDHLIICHECKLVFVIETKMWGGIITGKVNDDMWRQNKDGEIKYYRNPIKQNKYHCKVVEKYYRGYKIINVVVFINNKNVPKSKYIIQSDQLISYIKRVYNMVYNRCIIGV